MNPDLAPYTSSRDQLHNALTEAGAQQRGTKYFCPFHEDKSTPNGSIHEKDGKWYFKCFSCGAGGDYFDILARAQGKPVEEVIRETLRDKTTQRPAAAASTPPKGPFILDSLEAVITWAEQKLEGKCTQRYFYTHPDTKLTELITLRIEQHKGGKEFRQCFPLPDGRYQVGYNNDKPRPLYNRARIRDSKTILFVEGEKCVHALHEIGIIATCAAGGANTDMAKIDWRPLAGKSIILWPDNDEPGKDGKIAGQQYIKNASDQLQALQPEPTISTINIKPLNLPIKGDAADYIKLQRQEGKTDPEIKLAILQLCEATQPMGPAAEVIQLVEAIVTGKHKPLDWLFPQLSAQTNALLPETITIFGGTPGSGKSWFVLENAMHFFDQGESVAILMLEESRPYWLRRAMVIRGKNSIHLDAKWMREHPDEARALPRLHYQWLERFGQCIHQVPGLYTEMKTVVKWIAEQVAKNTRLIIVDPITLAIVEGELFREELKALSEIKQDIQVTGSSLILVTHPKQGNIPIGMNAMAGSAAYQRAVQTILWMEHLDDDNEFLVKRIHKPDFGAPTVQEVSVTCNRQLHLLKTRNGQGHNLKIAYHFEGKTVSFAEQGLIIKSTHKNKAGNAGV